MSLPNLTLKLVLSANNPKYLKNWIQSIFGLGCEKFWVFQSDAVIQLSTASYTTEIWNLYNLLILGSCKWKFGHTE